MTRPDYFLTDGLGRRTEFLTCDSRNSLRDPDGDLILRANPLDFRYGRRSRAYDSGSVLCVDTLGSGFGMPNTDSDASIANKAYASFVKKLHNGDASLGVTLGSWRQSASMITNRAQAIRQFLGRIPDTPETRRRWNAHTRSKDFNSVSARAAHLGEASKSIANKHLEWIFGWVPLYEDLFAAANVITGPVAPVFVKGTGRVFTEDTGSQPLYPGTMTYGRHFMKRCRYSARVQINNPNLWLLNRLGLINPAMVLWDRIPWSFVVGMFVNMNAVVKSFTDFVGLDVSDLSTTWSVNGYTDYTRVDPNEKGSIALWQAQYRFKRRTVGGTIPRPTFEFRVPELSWGTAAMATSLAVQQATRLLKVFR